MADLGGFDAEATPPSQDFDAVPAGKYEAVITDSEWIDNSSGNGRHLKLTMQIVSGEYANRNLWDRLNLENPSEKAVQIARGTLSRICRAVGIMKPKDSSELHGLPMIVRVEQRKDVDDPAKVYNDVKGYYPKEGAQQAAPAPAAASKPAPAPSKPAAAPWAKAAK